MPDIDWDAPVTFTLRYGDAAAAVQTLGGANNTPMESERARKLMRDQLASTQPDYGTVEKPPCEREKPVSLPLSDSEAQHMLDGLDHPTNAMTLNGYSCPVCREVGDRLRALLVAGEKPVESGEGELKWPPIVVAQHPTLGVRWDRPLQIVERPDEYLARPDAWPTATYVPQPVETQVAEEEGR